MVFSAERSWVIWQMLIEELAERTDMFFGLFRKPQHIGRENPALRFAHWNAKSLDSAREKFQRRQARPPLLWYALPTHRCTCFEAEEGNDDLPFPGFLARRAGIIFLINARRVSKQGDVEPSRQSSAH